MRNSTRIAVQNKTIRAIRSINPLRNDLVHNLIGNQLPGVHNGLGALPDFALLGNGCTQHITCGELRNSMLLGKKSSLRPLTCSGRPKKYQSHLLRFPPLSLDFLINPSY